MDYIEKYIYAVIKNLPEKDREEVSRELRANIMDMLGDDQSDAHVISTLEKMGNPNEMSLEYLGKDDYLIGPRLYYKYIEVLKVIFFVGLIIGLITFIVDLFANIDNFNTFSDILTLIAEGLGNVIATIIGFIFWVTVIFAIIEKTKSYDEIFGSKNNEFKVNNLNEIPKKSTKKISKVEMVFALFFTVLFLWLFLLRSDLIAIYVRGQAPIPVFNRKVIESVSLLILFSGALSILLSILKFVIGRWNEVLGVFAAIYALISLGVFILIITRDNLFNEGFLSYLDKGTSITGLNFNIYEKFPSIIYGIIAVSCIFTLIDIVTSLYNGFKRDKLA
ncbi:MAG: hypothetical protein WBI17_06150 [Clostridiaceae bacterium]